MKVPKSLADGFGQGFQDLLAEFAAGEGLIQNPEELASDRFLRRSVLPHVEKLSQRFNRLDDAADEGGALKRYWKDTSNAANLRLAYFLAFMPPNLCRMAAVWSELERYGFTWPESDAPFRALELGAGPATGTAGLLAGMAWGREGQARPGTYALVDSDKAVVGMGARWAQAWAEWLSPQTAPDCDFQTFHRKLSFSSPEGLLPRSAPKFDLWMSSYFLNEFDEPAADIAQTLIKAWERHLSDRALIILVEPALRTQSRRLLELRREILARVPKLRYPLQVLLPCLGHQACGALANPQDWCHEEVLWWRPPYLRTLDQMAGLDHKSLPFSYLVLARGEGPLSDWLPGLPTKNASRRERLVSPVSKHGECYVCGEKGKRRIRAPRAAPLGDELGRGSVIDLG